MKICEPCGASAAADAPHCVHCGEASWAPVRASASAPVSTIADDAPTPVVPPLAPESPLAEMHDALNEPRSPIFAPSAPQVPRRKGGNR